MICQMCGAEFKGTSCWNCKPAFPANEKDVPEITKTIDDLPKELQEHLKTRGQNDN